MEEYRRIAKEYLLRFVDYEVIIDGLREGKEEG